jgi:hypothetical protein
MLFIVSPFVPVRLSACTTASCRGTAFICNNSCLWYVIFTRLWPLSTYTHTCCRKLTSRLWPKILLKVKPHACGPKNFYSNVTSRLWPKTTYSSVVSASIWTPSQVSINAPSLIMDASRVAFAAAARWCASRTEVTHCSCSLPVPFRMVATDLWKRLRSRISNSSDPCLYHLLTCSPSSSISNCFLG